MMKRILAIFCLLTALFVSPVQDDTKRTYPNVVQAVPGGGASTLESSFIDIGRFLTNNCDGPGAIDCQSGAATVGPGWTVFEAYSNAGRCGAAANIDALSACAALKGNGSGLALGDWIVLESVDSSGGGGIRHFQVLIEYDSTTTLKFVMMPLENWQTGIATPDAAGTEKRVGGGAALISFGTVSAACNMSIVADEDVMIILRDDGTTPRWIYAGGVDGNLATSTPPDDRPFVIMDSPSLVYFNPGGGEWNRLAPDDATTLIVGHAPDLNFGSYVQDGAGTYNGSYQLYSVPIYFADASHTHLSGVLQYVRRTSKNMGVAGHTVNSLSYACRGNSASYSPICISWDGATVFP